MNYYKIVYDYENDEDAIFLEIDEDLLSFNRYAVNKNNLLGVTEIICNVKEENISNFDYIANDLGWLVVSERVKSVFEDSKLGSYEFIPVKRSDTREIVGYLFHNMNIIDALDEKESVCTRAKGVVRGEELELLFVMKHAVEYDKVRNFDSFKLETDSVPNFISETLKNKLLEIGAKGFDFLKIKMT